MLFKIGKIDNQQELAWDNIFQAENYPSFSRLRIGCKSKEIPLILEFCQDMQGPFGVLHVLLVSRLRKEPGRYQTPQPLSYEELEQFLYKHQDYFADNRFRDLDQRSSFKVSDTAGGVSCFAV